MRIAVGLILLLAAFAKLDGFRFDPLARDSLLASPRAQIAVIELELFLGLWLLSGLAQRWARYAALVFFGMLAVASLYMAIEGRSLCGCFGRVEINPWWTFGLDVLCLVALLLVGRPRRTVLNQGREAEQSHRPHSARWSVACGLVLLPAGLLIQWWAASELTERHPLVAERPVLDFGTLPEYSTAAGEVVFLNKGSRALEVLRVCVGCRCSEELLPANGVIEGRASFAVPVRVHAGPQLGYQQSVIVSCTYRDPERNRFGRTVAEIRWRAAADYRRDRDAKGVRP